MTHSDMLRELALVLGPDGLLTDEAERRLHSGDLFGQGGLCVAVVRPADPDQLVAAVKVIAQAGLAITPRGGGLTYVSGYTHGAGGHVAVDLRRMNRIVEISPTNMTITVEAGVTWQQIYEALKPLGLRLPFFGTFSGRGATVGGGLSNGALFLGTARHGTAAEAVVGLEVVLANGDVLHTGQRGVALAPDPFFRTFGPDTTAMFTHDAGAFGIKSRATLRLIRAPEVTDFLSFGFATQAEAIEAICEIGRNDLAEDAYVMDADKTRLALSSPSDLASDIKTLAKVVRQEKGLLRGLKAGAQLAMAGRDFIEAGCHSLHLVLAGRSRAGVDADMAAARDIAARLGGKELPNSIPKATRAEMFSPLHMVLGPQSDRWLALNAKVSHGQAQALSAAVEALIAQYQPRLDAAGVMVSRLLTVIGTHAFSYEPVFNWRDEWLPMHHATLAMVGATDRFSEPAPAPDTRALVMELRARIIQTFAEHGAASNQIGRTYRYASVLRPETLGLIRAIKAHVDPDGRMNPGALEL
ncbi:FAD-binding protein [Novosphingobium sp. FSY-8]|uniref:FAD-binding protein n=1 Tax=Novosphingobium ovatum TaxID=1908523 RepID=A0ABW9XBW6_9SPHN|nr:FAD-binding oxidoreductase [Novosphingobium ovatum]NBC36026.1 FAD-binding protein [Novosphingobium ovatum]